MLCLDAKKIRKREIVMGCSRFGLNWFWGKNSSNLKINWFAVWFDFGWQIKKSNPVRSNFMRFNLDQFLDIRIINYIYKNINIIKKI
jgi:hypothetical protein